MDTFWEIVASNAVVAPVLAISALLLGRIWKNAAAIHVLWLVVLLKLFTPPLFITELPFAGTFSTPAVSASSREKAGDSPALRQSEPPAPVAETTPRRAVAAGNQRPTHWERPMASRGHRSWSFSTFLAAIWFCGACGMMLVHTSRIRRFVASIHAFEAAPPAIRATVAQLAGRLGLRRSPDVLMTSRALPPLVWSLGIAPRVILPTELFARLSPAAQGTILAHELVHIRRGDHLVRLLELAATTIFWWHPVVWLASGQLRELEEQCCDGRVLELLPDPPRTYATTLVDTLEFLAGRTCPPVPLRTAIDPTQSLTRRIQMLNQRRTHRLSVLSATLVAGLTALPLAVAFAVGPEPTVKPAPEREQPAGVAVAVLRGRATNKAGLALPGVRVRVAVPAIDMRFADASPDHLILEARSDVNGDYRLELPMIRERTTLTMDAMMPGYRRLVGTIMGGGDARRIEVEPGKTAEASFALEPARYYGGTVVDQQGKPIEGVEVTGTLVSPRSTTYVEQTKTSPGGVFEIFGFPDGQVALANAGEVNGLITFSHPNSIESKSENIDAIERNQRERLRIVMASGHQVTGTVLDVAGKPVANAMVKAVLSNAVVTHQGDETHRKATVTDATGKFALRGLSGGLTTLSVRALGIKQKIQMAMALDGDQNNLEIRLQPTMLPADLKKYVVLGIELTDVTQETKAAYDLYLDRGAVILDPGKDFDRLKIGEIAEGYCFWLVGEKPVNSVREFVNQIIAETGGRDADEYSVRVVYTFSTPEFEGTNTQHLKLTKDDLKQLQAVADQLAAEAR